MEREQQTITQGLQLVSYLQASALKEIGFNWLVSDFFHENLEQKICSSHDDPDNYNSDDWDQDYLSRPTVALVFKWLREVPKIHIYTYLNAGKDAYNISIDKTNFQALDDFSLIHKHAYESNDMAESIALNVVLDYLVKNKLHLMRVELQQKKEYVAEHILKLGNTVFFTHSKTYPAGTLMHGGYETKRIILRGKVINVENQFIEVILTDNNGFEMDGSSFVFHCGSVLADQNFKDFDQLGKWKKPVSQG